MLHNFWLAKPYGLANQKLCYIPIDKSSRKRDKEYSWEWLVNTNLTLYFYFTNIAAMDLSLSFAKMAKAWRNILDSIIIKLN